jgi:glucuronokinase
MIIETQTFARAGFLGNPSDGYFGKTISIAFENFAARVALEQADMIRIITPENELNAYDCIEDLAHQIGLYGYYGAERLVKAAIKKFHEYCLSNDIQLDEKNFTIRVHSHIPRQVGLGGSSAIVTACIRSLMQFYGVTISPALLPSLTLQTEADELGINAGLQDRVIQVHGGCLYMDFSRDVMETNASGRYERLDPGLLPPLFVAYKRGLGKVSGRALNTIRIGYDRGDELVLHSLQRIAEIAEEGKQALIDRDFDLLFGLINENFDWRSRIMQISKGDREMIETARRLGAAAKFAGSGGAIIGMYKNENMYGRLVDAFRTIRAEVIKPVVTGEDS